MCRCTFTCFFCLFFFNLGCYLFQKTEISDLSVLDPLASPASTSLPPPRDITTLRQLLHIWSGPPRQLRPRNALCQVHLTMRTRNIDVIQRPFFPPKHPFQYIYFREGQTNRSCSQRCECAQHNSAKTQSGKCTSVQNMSSYSCVRLEMPGSQRRCKEIAINREEASQNIIQQRLPWLARPAHIGSLS